MRRMITAILGAVIFLALPSTARADNIPLDPIMFFLSFEGIPVGHEVDDYYYIGLGIHFTDGFIANGHDAPPCQSGGGPCTAELTSSSVIMDVYPGFQNFLSFYYHNSDGGEISIYSGLDGTGDVLRMFPIPAQHSGEGWEPLGESFMGTAYSVKIAGNPGIEFTSLNNVGLVTPEPTSLILLATGVAGLAGWRRRRDSTQK